MQDFLTLSAGLPLALLLGLGVPAVVWLLYYYLTFGVVLVLSTFFLDLALAGLPGLQVGINLYLPDVVFAPITVAAVLRLVLPTEVPTRSGLWLLFGALLAVSFAIGVAQFGKGAANDLRSFFYFWTGALYLMSFPADEGRTRQIMSCWLAFSVLLLGLACFRWLAEFSGMSIAASWRNTTAGPAAQFRVVGSAVALCLAQALVIAIYVVTAQTAKRWVWASVPALLCAVVVLQHRSVWIAAGVGIVVLYMVFPGKLRIKLMRPMIAAGVLVLALTVGLVGYGKLDSLTNKLTESASTATELDRGTVGARIYGWEQLLMSMEPQHYLIGQPFGTSYKHYEGPRDKKAVEYSPHNFYVETLLRTGMIGLLLFLAAYLSTMRHLLMDRDVSSWPSLPPRLVFVLLVMQLVYFVAYSKDYPQGLLLGVALSMAATLRRANAAKSEGVYTAVTAVSYGSNGHHRAGGLSQR